MAVNVERWAQRLGALEHQPVGRKLTGTFMLVGLLLLAVGFFSTAQIHKVSGTSRQIGEVWLPAAADLGRMSADVTDYQRLVLRAILETDPALQPAVATDLDKVAADFDRHAGAVQAYLVAPQERARLEEARRAWQAYTVAARTPLALAGQNRRVEAFRQVKGEVLPRYQQAKDAIGARLDEVIAAGNRAAKASAVDDRVALGMNVLAVLLMLVLTSAIAAFVARVITGRLAQLDQAAKAIAGGRLDVRAEIESRDEFGDLARAFTAMSARLMDVVARVRSGAHAVAASADISGASVQETHQAMEAIAVSIQEVAHNTDTLASNVEETSATIEEMAASIKQVAVNADTLSTAVSQTTASISQMAVSIQQVAGNVERAHDSARQAVEAARYGSEAVTETIAGMGQISEGMHTVVQVMEALGERSAEIGQIVELIEEIADQTNLLALNAAIEAARAGEHGRGFAVVADEVRKLAERSGKATQEITQRIKGMQAQTSQAVRSTQASGKTVEHGVELAQRAGASLTRIVGAVDEVQGLMVQINQAAREQAQASTQITQAAGYMDRVTQQVSHATSEQAKSAEQIILAVEMMNRLIRQVSGATHEQKRAGEQVVVAIEQVARQGLDLQRQSQTLLDTIAFFCEGQPPHLEVLVQEAPQPLALVGR